MASSQNFPAERSPAGWASLDRQSRRGPWRLSTTASVLNKLSHAARSQRGGWLIALGLGAIAAAVYYRRVSSHASSTTSRLPSSATTADEAVDRASEASFPASDPPAFMTTGL